MTARFPCTSDDLIQTLGRMSDREEEIAGTALVRAKMLLHQNRAGPALSAVYQAAQSLASILAMEALAKRLAGAARPAAAPGSATPQSGVRASHSTDPDSSRLLAARAAEARADACRHDGEGT